MLGRPVEVGQSAALYVGHDDSTFITLVPLLQQPYLLFSTLSTAYTHGPDFS